jgi:hypothetical protein
MQPMGLGGIDDASEIAQLSTIRYRHTPRGQVLIVPKKEMTEKLGFKSPDRAEGDMLCYAPDEQPLVTVPDLPGSASYSYT